MPLKYMVYYKWYSAFTVTDKNGFGDIVGMTDVRSTDDQRSLGQV